MAQIEKSFNDCTLVYLEKTFGLRQVYNALDLIEWQNLASKITLSDFEKAEINIYQEQLIDNILHWNEQELSIHFIGPIDRKSTRLNSSHITPSRMPSSA